MEVPDKLRCVFSASVEAGPDETYTVEIPKREIETGTIQPGAVYRLALLSSVDTPSTADASATTDTPDTDPDPAASGPPVHEGEVRTVDIDDIGDQGDGIARVEHGYVLIVPETEPGERVKIEIATVRDNVAFGEVIDRLTTPRQGQNHPG